MAAPAVHFVKGPIDYILRRVAVYLGVKEALFPHLIAQGARADGWLAVEAFNALRQPYIASQYFQDVRLTGATQGGSPDDPDLELTAQGQPLRLQIRSVPLTAQRPLAYYFTTPTELPRRFRFLHAHPSTSALLLVAYPLRMDNPDWENAVKEAEQAHQVRRLDQVQFILPGPDRVTVSVWRHVSAGF
ncbi:MAG: hypothetical protein NZ951_01400 [Dehalococcoidia bacterium]|nr:hypothetical protein [Dehalococcoidia bacterium]MDW8119487.1 hypothetical protein [Chloroflexota bacterium]